VRMNRSARWQWSVLLMVVSVAGAQGQLVISAGTPPPFQSGTIVTSGTMMVASGSCVAYTATQQIKLEPGFTAVAGSTFHAEIGSLLTVGTTTLGAGTVGVAFSATLNASGGTLTGGGGYTWSVSGLPSGLGLSNGVISGTPQGPVTGAQVVLTVRDSVCQQVSATVGMTIDDTEAGSFSFVQKTASVWFGGRLVSEGTVPAPGGSAGAVFQDRLGTNRAGGARFYPYGEEIGAATANDRVKFGTYNRDSFTGLDYGDQRFYASSYGRFNTPDRIANSSGAWQPGGWNRYAYVTGDPITFNDPTGRGNCNPDDTSGCSENCVQNPLAAECSVNGGNGEDGENVAFSATGTAVADPEPDPEIDPNLNPAPDPGTGTEPPQTGSSGGSGGPPCIDGLRDVSLAQGQQLINNAMQHIGTPYRSGPGLVVCTEMVCCAIRLIVPSFPEGPARGWGNHESLRPLRPGEPNQAGDVIRFPGHVGLVDPVHVPSIISATSHGVRWTSDKFFGPIQGYSRVQVPCK
jgi:RHS repeat-associated protein